MEEDSQGLLIRPGPIIKKKVKCLKCGTEMEVEFEIELAPLIPAIGGGFINMPAIDEEKDNQSG